MEHKNHIEKRIERKAEYYVTKAIKIFFMIILAILFFLLFGYVVMWLWNWLMPDLFGLATITYWQAFGLLVLSKIFFGFGSGGPGKSGSGRRKSKRRFSSEKCGPMRRDFSEWKLYDRFWKEEGEQAFKAYVDRTRENERKDSEA